MVKKISRDTLLHMMRSEGTPVKIVDVLGEDHYRREHIKGAISLPLGKIDKYADRRLRRDERIVVYCTDITCHAGEKAADKLAAKGFPRVYDYAGGLEDYKQAGLPVEGSPDDPPRE